MATGGETGGSSSLADDVISEPDNDAIGGSVSTDTEHLGPEPSPGAFPCSRSRSRSSGGSSRTTQGGGEEGGGPAGVLYMRLRVDGIKCEGCAARLKAALLAHPGVVRAAVDYGAREVRLWGDAGLVSEAGVVGAVQWVDLGYRVTVLESGLVAGEEAEYGWR